MTPENAKNEFEERIKKVGISIGALTPAQGIRLALDFYKDVRADGCEMDNDGDMLLFQWGTYHRGQGRAFQFDITRQFIISKGEDNDATVSQLSFRFHFMPSASLDAIKSGNRWCSTPEKLKDFEAFIVGSDAYRVVQALVPSRAALDYSVAG